MIHIILGTKAQTIKLMPVISRLKNEGITFNLVDLGQHSLTTGKLRLEFALETPNAYLYKGKNIATFGQGLLWIGKLFLKSLSTSRIKKELFRNEKGICLIHGDTASTLIGLYLAKRAGLKVAHIEAGLRSFCWFEPFPEEILRIVCMRFSDILFAPSKQAYNNLLKMGLKEKSVLLSANTSYESCLYSLNKPVEQFARPEKYALITVHRMENITSKKKLSFIIDLLRVIAENMPVIFVQHQPTIHRLNKFGLREKLEKVKNTLFLKLLSHAHFIHLLKGCELVMSDGGSIQEESYYLNKPCLLLRNVTERNEGMGENVMLSQFNTEKINYFLRNYNKFTRIYPLNNTNNPPSKQIVETIKHFR